MHVYLHITTRAYIRMHRYLVIVFVAYGVSNDGDFGKIISEIKFANYLEQTDLRLDDINGKTLLPSLVLKPSLSQSFRR